MKMHIINTLLGFDFGIKRIGVAVGQQVTKTANPLSVIKIKKGEYHWNQIEKLMKDWQPNYLVVGLPLNMDGSEQPITTLTYKFVNNLYKKFGICIKMQDERLSTVEARATLFERGGYKALQKGKIDSYSAVIILEDWFANY